MTSPEDVIASLFGMGIDPRQKHNSLCVDFTETVHHDTYDFIDPTQFDLAGRTVFITGASRGIGSNIAISFAKAGASNIIVGARSSLDAVKGEVLEAAKLAKRAVPNVLALNLDITSQASVEAAAKEILQSFGGVDIVINNAGYMEPPKPFLELDPEEFRKGFDVNVMGTYLIARSMIPLLLNHKAPNPLKTIVTIGSVWGLTTLPLNPSYQMSKLALIRFSQLLSASFPSDPDNDTGLLAFTVHPGGVLNDMGKEGLVEHMQFLLSDTPQLAGDTMVWLTAKRRTWLRDRYVNGSVDMQELEAKKDEILREDLLKLRLSVGGDHNGKDRLAAHTAESFKAGEVRA